MASGPRTAQFSESASALNRTEWATTDGVLRSLRAVRRRAGEVHEVLAGRAGRAHPRRCRRAAAREPSGSRPLSTIRRTTASVRYAVWLAGFTIVGTPARNAGRQLLEEAPHREVEGVDLHGHPAQRRPEVLAGERAALAERLDGAVEDGDVVRQLALRLARVGRGRCRSRRRCRPALSRSVAPVRARHRVELVLVGHQPQGELLEQAGALVERQLAQRRPADGRGRGRASPGRRGRCC